MTTRVVSGEFEVKMAPREQGGPALEAGLGRLSLDKRYHGELEATGKGEMMAVQGLVQGSAGYVALERVTGTLGGKSGSFVIQHGGIMDRGEPSLSIVVVPDTGTEGLSGLVGWMGIRIEGGKHYYDFEYAMPEGA